MKANELMINDKVFVKVLSQIPDTYVIHTWTAKDYLKDRLQIKPIPLTTEILEKNGFKFERDCVLGLHDEYCVVKAIWLEEGNMYVYINFIDKSDFSQSINKHINYVHELQHALRLCGLNELANNFKV